MPPKVTDNQTTSAESLHTVEGDTAAGRCNGFTGSAYCYLRTDKDPQVDNETCRISPVCGGYEGCWYLVEILQPEFSFSLKE